MHERGIGPEKHPAPTKAGEIWKARGKMGSLILVIAHHEGWVEAVTCDAQGKPAPGHCSRNVSRHMFGTPRGYRLFGTRAKTLVAS